MNKPFAALLAFVASLLLSAAAQAQDMPATCDKNCPAPFVANAFWTTQYGPAAANVVLSSTNFLACRSKAYALCYYSGPSTGSPSLPCTAADNYANCRCYVESGLSFVDINSIRNTEAYVETVRACGIDGSGCRNMASLGQEKQDKTKPSLPAAPVCDYLQAGADGSTPMEPKSELISTFSFAKTSTYGAAQKNCSTPAPYAGCMTASCTYERDPNGNKTGYANCKCPIYTGPYQIGQGNASCDAGSGLVWSAAYSPSQVQLPFPLKKD